MDEKVALASCFPEMNESFCMIFGSIWRVLKTENSYFYVSVWVVYGVVAKPGTAEDAHGELLRVGEVALVCADPEHPGLAAVLRGERHPEVYKEDVGYGGWEVDGLEFYVSIMVYCQESGVLRAWDGLLEKYNQEYQYIPLRCLNRVILTQQYLSQFYGAVEQSKLAKKWLEYCEMRVGSISNQEIKDCEIETIKEAINEQAYFFKKGISSEGLDKFLEEKQLALGLKFLRSPFLEKRVKGVTEIKDILERFETTKRRLVSKDFLVKWLQENQILEMLLLGDSVHPELIKRAGEIGVFLCRNSVFQSEMIDKIWQQSEGKHETIQLAVYDLLRQLSPFMNLEMVNRLYGHIEKIRYQDYKEQTIQLVKTFTDHALSRKIQAQIQSNDTRRFFGFNQLWELLQDREQSIVQPHIQELAFSVARAIVSQINQTKQFLHHFFAKCFELIREHRSVYQAISFSHYILDKQFTEDQQGKKQLIKATNEKYQIIELFVKEIEVYLEKVREHFKEQEPQDVVIWGVQTFQQNMFFRLQMLNYLLQHQELKITYD